MMGLLDKLAKGELTKEEMNREMGYLEQKKYIALPLDPADDRFFMGGGAMVRLSGAGEHPLIKKFPSGPTPG